MGLGLIQPGEHIEIFGSDAWEDPYEDEEKTLRIRGGKGGDSPTTSPSKQASPSSELLPASRSGPKCSKVSSRVPSEQGQEGQSTANVDSDDHSISSRGSGGISERIRARPMDITGVRKGEAAAIDVEETCASSMSSRGGVTQRELTRMRGRTKRSKASVSHVISSDDDTSTRKDSDEPPEKKGTGDPVDPISVGRRTGRSY